MTQENNSANIAGLKAGCENEPIARFLSMTLEELSPGYARISARLRPEYRNFNGFIFGGIIMSLADQAFAYAINSVSPRSVASQFNIHFIAAPQPDDELVAEGRAVKSGRRVGISEMSVSTRSGKLIARATGTTIPIEA